MSKNIIWILVIGFVLGFISYEQLSNFSTTEGNASFWEIISALGSLLVPIVLAIWAWYSEHQKNKKAKREKDKEYIQIYVENKLMPLTFEKTNFLVENDERKIQELLLKSCIKLIHLADFIEHSSFSYMYDFFSFFEKFTDKIADEITNESLSEKELDDFYLLFSTYIHTVPLFLLRNEQSYKNEVLETITIFLGDEVTIRNTMLVILKKEFPRYHKYAINYIEELEKEVIDK